MKLTEVTVKNFRSYVDSHTLHLAEAVSTLVGPNNCGKSNFLRAINLALDPEYRFDRSRDTPNQLKYAYPKVTLEFSTTGRTSGEKTLLRYLQEYERSLLKGSQETYAEKGVIRYVVEYRTNRRSGYSRNEYFAVKGSGNRRGSNNLNDRAVAQFHKITRLISVDSGQSLDSLLRGRFRDVLHSVLKGDLKVQYKAAEKLRDSYIEGLQQQILDPLSTKVHEVAGGIFPELSEVRLSPSVSGIEETLSELTVHVNDAVGTALEHKGSGVSGGILVALLRYLAESSSQTLIITLEEPESFLHPGAQEFIRRDLDTLSGRNDVTLLVSTHSPHILSRRHDSVVVSVKKSLDGRSSHGDVARGNEDHFEVISGLFADSSIPKLLDRSRKISHNAEYVLLVEGSTDQAFLEISARKLGRQPMLDRVQVIPAGGTQQLVAQAIILDAEIDIPVRALLDSDENGREAKRHLISRFGFNKADIIEYGKYNPGTEDAEAEWMFDSSLLQKFVTECGEDIVLKQKSLRFKAWRFDFTPTGKGEFPNWLKLNSRASDFRKWKMVLDDLERWLTKGDSAR